MDRVKRQTGRFAEKSSHGEAYKCYIPQKLPPVPPIHIERFYGLLDQANVALGELNGIKVNLPDASLLLSAFSKKEAVLSSQIEGTQSSLSDYLLSESRGEDSKAGDDEREVANYMSAMEHGLQRIQSLPLSRRLLCEIHEKLLAGSRGGEKCPGEFRSSQNWIGGARPGNAVYVPPPPENLSECFGDFEKFLHDKETPLPVLIKIALAHVQFESIHPFLDGNGRLGRLLITFMLCLSGLLKEPLLYLSLYFKTRRPDYYRLLQSVRETGDWEAWIDFFLRAVHETAGQAFQAAQDIVSLFARDEDKIKRLGKDTAGVLKTYSCLKRRPIASVKNIVREAKSSHQTVLRSLRALEEISLARELTGRYRNKIFVYKSYIDIIDRGTELPAKRGLRF